MEQFTLEEIETIKHALAGHWSYWLEKSKEEGIGNNRANIRLELAEDSWALYEKVRDILGEKLGI